MARNDLGEREVADVGRMTVPSHRVAL